MKLTARLAQMMQSMQNQAPQHPRNEMTVEELQQKLAASEAKAGEFASLLTEVAEMQAAADAAAFNVSMEARKQELTSAIGTAKATDIFEKTKTMSDEHFAVLMSAVGMSQSKEESNPLFQEAGVEAEADVQKLTAQARMINYLTARLPQSK